MGVLILIIDIHDFINIQIESVSFHKIGQILMINLLVLTMILIIHEEVFAKIFKFFCYTATYRINIIIRYEDLLLSLSAAITL